jgi:predicted Zn-dependent protease
MKISTFLLLALCAWLPLSALMPLSVWALDIDEATARQEMARVLRDSGNHTEAIKAYQVLLHNAPQNPAAVSELAEVLVWTEQHEEAAKLLATIPEEQWTPSGLSAAADIDTHQGRFADAEKRLRSLLQENPNSDPLQVRLASVLSWQEKFNESVEIFAGLVEKNPKDVQLRRRYAQVLGWAGKPEAASEQWRISLEADR